MELKGKTVNFLGDSITQGSGASSQEHFYCNVLKEKFGLKCANNYGIGGTRFARQQIPSIESKWDKYFASRVDEMEKDVDAVVVFGGTNDFGHGDAPLGSFDDRTPDTFYGACHDLFKRLIEKYAGIPIVVVTPLHRLSEENIQGENGRKGKDYGTLKDYVDIILEVARYYSLPVCDLFASSGLQPNVPVINEKFFADGLHPNDAGHAAVADKIGTFLLNL